MSVVSYPSREPLPVRTVKRALFGALDLLAPLAFGRAHSATALEPRKILVIQLQQVGDSVIFTPTLRAIRERFPNAEIAMLVNRVSAQFYKKSPWVNRFWLAKDWHAGPGGASVGALRPLLEEIKAERYDVVITDITQQAFKYSLVAFLTGAPVRVGFNDRGRGALHTVQVPLRPGAPWPDNNLDLARALGATPSSGLEELSYDSSDAAHIDALFAEQGVDASLPVVLMHVGANWQSRRWFADRWAAVADALVNRHRAQVIFVGTEQERPIVDEARGLMRMRSFDFVGKTDLPQLSALLRRARLFIGTDSGPRHMAGAAGIPHVVLMCAQDDTDQWVKFRTGERLMRELPDCRGCFAATCSHQTCMKMIDVARVIALCEEELAVATHAQVFSTNVA